MDWPKLLQAISQLVQSLAGLLIVLTLVKVLWSGGAVDVIAKTVGRLRRVKTAGLELDLTPENVERLRNDIEAAFEELRVKINREFDYLVYAFGVDEQLQNLIEDYVRPLLRSEVERDFRCTVFVADVLYEDSILQLTDYYPRGSGRGRVFPIRFGIIGRTWRSGQDQIEGEIPTDRDELVLHWGMTTKEAAGAGQGRHSFACFVLRDSNDAKVGMLYLDATVEHAFDTLDGQTEWLRDAVQWGAKACGLVGSLADIQREMRERGPTFRFFARRGG
jgi:hypothetical protein